MKYQVVVGSSVAQAAEGLVRGALSGRDPHSMLAVIVIGGERVLVCDEAIVATDTQGTKEEIVGIATISESGESGSSIPEIVGLFVAAQHRRHGIARELFLRALKRCEARRALGEPRFEKVGVSVLHPAVKRIVDALPAGDRARLVVHDHTDAFSFFSL
ncbi:MAG: GNAT family N-acetyltransferase [Patescibacteria group bacterium]